MQYSDIEMKCGMPLPLNSAFEGIFYTPVEDLHGMKSAAALSVNKAAREKKQEGPTVTVAPTGLEAPDCSYQASFNRLMKQPAFNVLVGKVNMNPFKGVAGIQDKIKKMIEAEMRMCERMSFTRP